MMLKDVIKMHGGKKYFDKLLSHEMSLLGTDVMIPRTILKMHINDYYGNNRGSDIYNCKIFSSMLNSRTFRLDKKVNDDYYIVKIFIDPFNALMSDMVSFVNQGALKLDIFEKFAKSVYNEHDIRSAKFPAMSVLINKKHIFIENPYLQYDSDDDGSFNDTETLIFKKDERLKVIKYVNLGSFLNYDISKKIKKLSEHYINFSNNGIVTKTKALYNKFFKLFQDEVFIPNFNYVLKEFRPKELKNKFDIFKEFPSEVDEHLAGDVISCLYPFYNHYNKIIENLDNNKMIEYLFKYCGEFIDTWYDPIISWTNRKWGWDIMDTIKYIAKYKLDKYDSVWNDLNKFERIKQLSEYIEVMKECNFNEDIIGSCCSYLVSQKLIEE